MRVLTLTTSLNDLDELASLAYDIEEGPNAHIAIDRAVAALRRANPTLALGGAALERGITFRVSLEPGLKPSDRTKPATSAHAARIDSLVEVIDAYEASLRGSSARRTEANNRRLDLVRSEEFSTFIRGTVRESTRMLDNLERKVEAERERDDKRNEQVLEALDRLKQDLQLMRKRVS